MRLPAQLRDMLLDQPLDGVTELRARAGQALEIRAGRESRLVGEAVSQAQLDEMVCELTGYSLYARETQIKRGFFTLPGGHRVGLTGTYALGEDGVVALRKVNALCIRVAHEILGAAEELQDHLLDGRRPRSALILSPPGMGKTTLLRDAARLYSEQGLRVAVCDERDELAAMDEGMPTMRLGPRCDVAGGCEKHEAIAQLVRAMSPDVIVTDELGKEGDAEAVMDAARSGVAVLASAHAGDYQQARRRKNLSPLLEEALFERLILLGGAPGRVIKVMDATGEVI